MKRSKAYRAAAEKIDPDRLYTPLEAVRLAKETSTTKFDAPSRSPCGWASTPARPTRWSAAPSTCRTAPARPPASWSSRPVTRPPRPTAAGADVVGSRRPGRADPGGFLDFDAAVATPDQMGKVGRIARILGPRGLMPNPKTGTVTRTSPRRSTDIKGGKIEFRVDKHANLHFVIGKARFTEQQLVENYAAALDEVLRAKPSAAKGRYLQEGHLHHHDGPRHPGRPEPDPRPQSRTPRAA